MERTTDHLGGCAAQGRVFADTLLKTRRSSSHREGPHPRRARTPARDRQPRGGPPTDRALRRPLRSGARQQLVQPVSGYAGQPARCNQLSRRRGVGHARAYLPEAGKTVACLLDRADVLEHFARCHFAGAWDADRPAMRRAMRRPGAGATRTLKQLLLWLDLLFRETLRHIYKMRYLSETPIRLANDARGAGGLVTPSRPAARRRRRGCVHMF